MTVHSFLLLSDLTLSFRAMLYMVVVRSSASRLGFNASANLGLQSCFFLLTLWRHSFRLSGAQKNIS